jgi:hypothetical protein
VGVGERGRGRWRERVRHTESKVSVTSSHIVSHHHTRWRERVRHTGRRDFFPNGPKYKFYINIHDIQQHGSKL